MASVVPVEYTEAHSSLLTVIMNEGVISYDDVVRNCQILWPDQQIWNVKRISKILQIINGAITILDQETRLVTCQVTNQRCVIVLNNINDEISRQQSKYSGPECEYFRRLLNAVLDADGYMLSSITCLNLTSKMVSPYLISKTKAEQAMKVWIRGGYFIEKDNNLYLGPRTIAEFEMYIRDRFSDVLLCGLCQVLVLYGTVCNHCECLVHKECWDTYISKTKKCPSCKTLVEVEEMESGDNV